MGYAEAMTTEPRWSGLGAYIAVGIALALWALWLCYAVVRGLLGLVTGDIIWGVVAAASVGATIATFLYFDTRH